MNPALRWRAEFYDPSRPDVILGYVDGDNREVAKAEPPPGAQARFRLLTPPDIRLGDHVRYDDGEGESFIAVVTRVGKPYPSGTFNVDLSREGVTQAVFCENCKVLFRPKLTPYKVEEALDVLHKQETLVGPEPGITAKVFQGLEDRVILTLWQGERRVDVFVYDGRDRRFQMSSVIRIANAWLFAKPVKVGDAWTEEINQGKRFVEVVEVKRLRYRIEYEMPKAGLMRAWRRGIMIGKLLYA